MGAKKIVFIFLFLTQHLFSQENEVSRNGFVQSTGTILPAIMLNHSVRNNYVGGHLEYRFDAHYSFRGDFLTYTGSQTKQRFINDHTMVSSSFIRNFDHQNWTYFSGVGFGLSVLQLESDSKKSFNQPTINFLSGIQYHANNFLYFYAEVCFSHLQNPINTKPLDQVFFTGGLVFQFPTRK